MTLEEARLIYKAALSLDVGLQIIDKSISEMEIPSEKEVWIDRLGQVFGVISREIIFPLENMYPELENLDK